MVVENFDWQPSIPSSGLLRTRVTGRRSVRRSGLGILHRLPVLGRLRRHRGIGLLLLVLRWLGVARLLWILRWLLILLWLLWGGLHLLYLRLYCCYRLRDWLGNRISLRVHRNWLHGLLRQRLLNWISLRVQGNGLRLARACGRSKLRLGRCITGHRLSHRHWLVTRRSDGLLRERLSRNGDGGIRIGRVESLAHRLNSLGRLVDGGKNGGHLVHCTASG